MPRFGVMDRSQQGRSAIDRHLALRVFVSLCETCSVVADERSRRVGAAADGHARHIYGVISDDAECAHRDTEPRRGEGMAAAPGA
jgi:hypothetical protein